MNFPESIDYLYGLQLFGMKLGLENMRALQRRLPDMQGPLSCVHVAGTNGKGSVSIMLAHILKQAGLKVGLYTSPHLHSFVERIRIDGVPISQDELVLYTKTTREATKDLPITFFEATTAIALMAFYRNRVDIAIMETGLGGRLDATNIINPRLCLITPVSYDHCEHLGDNLSDIAFEKAGIIKPGVPVVVGKQDDEAMTVIQGGADKMSADVLACGRDYRWSGQRDHFRVESGAFHIDDLTCNLEGLHQVDNFAQAVIAAEQLRLQGLSLSMDAVRRAGKTLSWPGRIEWWGEDRKILADVAHNRAGIEVLAQYLENEGIDRVRLVVGMSGLRNPDKVLKPLENIVSAVYAVPVSYNQVISLRQICQWGERNNVPCQQFVTAETGMTAALANKGVEPVLVCGSLYLVAELREKFRRG